MNVSRIRKQWDFIKAIDALKSVQRKTYLIDGSRFENSAEHSWAVSTLAFLLGEYASDEVDINKVIVMLLIHDIVEIDAGDTLLYDDVLTESKKAREEQAAKRLFSILPEDQTIQLRSVWEEFESEETAESVFAAGIDRLIPLIHNISTNGRAWRELGIHYDQIMAKNTKIAKANPILWEVIKTDIDELFAPDFTTL